MIRRILDSLSTKPTLRELRARDGWRRWATFSDEGYKRQPDGSLVCEPKSQRRIRRQFKLSARQWRNVTKRMRRHHKARAAA